MDFVSGDKEISVTNKNAGEVISGSILVKSKVEALHFINLDAILKFNKIEQAGNTNIQFQVGENQNLQKANVTETKGEKFLDIPAK